MFRKFKCRNCGVTFSADDTKLVACPGCNSDDIETVRESNNTVKIIAIAAGVLIAAVGITALLRRPVDDPDLVTDNIAVVVDNPEEKVDPTQSELSEEMANSLEPLKISAPEADEKTKTYTITVTPNRGAKGVFKYYLTDLVTGDKKEYNAVNGKISNIPPASAEDYSYIILVEDVDADGNVIEKGESEWSGFVKFPESTIEKLSIAQIQTHINNLLTGNINLTDITRSGKYTLDVSAVIKNGETTRLGRIMTYANMEEWNGATVTNAEYDSSGRVSKIYITPIK